MIDYININKDFSISDKFLNRGSITKESGNIKRNSKVFFIKDVETCREIFNLINNTTLVNLADIEPLQMD